MFHSHEPHAPWQTPEWVELMRETLRPSAYLRQIQNRFTAGEGEFIDLAKFDACVDRELTPVLTDPSLPVFFGVDASTKKDSTAITGCTFNLKLKKVQLVIHRTFQPSPRDPLDFESTIEDTLLDFRKRFRMIRVLFDPWQMVSVAQRLTKRGLPMMEFPQSSSNLTLASQNLYDLINGKNLRPLSRCGYPASRVACGCERRVARLAHWKREAVPQD